MFFWPIFAISQIIFFPTKYARTIHVWQHHKSDPKTKHKIYKNANTKQKCKHNTKRLGDCRYIYVLPERNIAYCDRWLFDKHYNVRAEIRRIWWMLPTDVIVRSLKDVWAMIDTGNEG